MKKIKSLFERNYETDRLVNPTVVAGSEWVIAGEGIATRKFDGTCCLVKNGELYKRYDVKKNRKAPEGFVPAQSPDETTGHWPGWVRVSPDNPSDKWFWRAWETFKSEMGDGTYELCGEHFQSNPENFAGDVFVKHGVEILLSVPRTFDGLKEWFVDKDIEGIVWHRDNGDMVKIKKKDFGLKR